MTQYVDYPFESHFLTLADGLRCHYVDEPHDVVTPHNVDQSPDRPVLLMVHGNPTWSYFWRHVITQFRDRFRCIAIDHIGCGLSDKPDEEEYPFTLQRRIDDLVQLIEHLDLKQITLIVHDWGGAIGFGCAINKPERIKKIIVLNTAAFFDKKIPKRINICRGIFSKFLIQKLNLFAIAATFMSTTKKLSKEIRKKYLEPYKTYESRIGIRTFVQDIPMEAEHRTRYLLDYMEEKLRSISARILILWGAKDFCFTEHFYNKFREIFPYAKARLFKNAGHYILEDECDEIIKEIEEFIK